MEKKGKKADKKFKISITEWLLAKREIIVGIAGGLVALYPIVNFMYNLSYQSKCEGFYGIPGKYFHLTIDNRLLYLICILILIFICATPIIIRKYDDKKQIQTKGLTVYFSFVQKLIMEEMMFMNEIKIIVENCNNISHDELMLEGNKLNIKYGMNGTGKSTLSTAISLISQGSDLTELKPFVSRCL